jgi:hypothetical protein
MAPGERLDQRRLLDRLPGPFRTARQTGQQRLVDRALPGVDPDQVLTEALQRLAAPVAVDQNPVALFARLGYGHHRHELALSLDGGLQAPEPGGIVQAQRREAWNQGVQVKVQDVLHGPYATRPTALCPSSPLFAIIPKSTLTLGKYMHFHYVRVHLCNLPGHHRNKPVSP